VTVQDRTAETLIGLIKRWIKPGTKILSDCWKSYAMLESEGYIHETVNHSVTFVSDTGVHTNTIESRWNSLKKSLPKYGTTKTLYDSYFAVLEGSTWIVQKTDFFQFLSLIAKVYQKKGPEEELNTEAQEDVEEEVRDALKDGQPIAHSTNVNKACHATQAAKSRDLWQEMCHVVHYDSKHGVIHKLVVQY